MLGKKRYGYSKRKTLIGGVVVKVEIRLDLKRVESPTQVTFCRFHRSKLAFVAFKISEPGYF